MKHGFVIGKYTLESLTNGLYASPLDMYREYIQNSVDSFDQAIKEGLELLAKLRIDISIEEEPGTVIIRDNGCGIKADTAVRTLLDIGNSQKSNQMYRGFRGIGRLAGLSYCDKLSFKTSYSGEECCTVIEFDAKQLRELLLPSGSDNTSVEDVIKCIVSVHTEKEIAKRRYFEVRLTGVWKEAGLTDVDVVRSYLIEHAPLYYSNEFKWGSVIEEKIRLEGYSIPQYHIYLNNSELTKPYEDTFISDRVKRGIDFIQDVSVESFYRAGKLSAIMWYAKTSYNGTILNRLIKGIRVRQGNILVGDRNSCSSIFKEERFNGWMIGELYIIDSEIIANSRRDGFEKNTAFFELFGTLKEWALNISKTIRHVSYERSLSNSMKTIVEANRIEELNDENELCSEKLELLEGLSESTFLDQSESAELAETDYISRLGFLITQKRTQTKYVALNINEKLTMDQRKVLERVFDLISQEYDKKTAERFVNTISAHF